MTTWCAEQIETDAKEQEDAELLPRNKTNKTQTLMCTQKCDMLYGKILDYIIRKSNTATIIGI